MLKKLLTVKKTGAMKKTAAKRRTPARPVRASSLPCGRHAVLGRRPYQEDTSILGEQFMDANGTFYDMAAVFDGHGGRDVSEFLEKNLARYIRCQLLRVHDASELPGALHRAFIDADKDLPESSLRMGSTAIVALVSDARIIVASTGDSRATLVSGDGGGTALAVAHNFSLPGEEERVINMGGSVLRVGGADRIMGVINMSRAFGDKCMRPYGMIPDPDVSIFERKPEDEFLVIASDGVTMADAKVAALTRMVAAKAAAKRLSRVAVCRIAADVLTRSSTSNGDNVTVVVLDLKGSHRLTRTHSEVLACVAPLALTRCGSC